jgi:hypothetical protein
MRKSKELPLSTGSRSVAVLAGTAYLVILAVLFSELSQVSFAFAGAFVFAGAAVIMICLGAFCLKFVLYGGERRVSLNTVLLLFVPLAIYLTGIHWLFNSGGLPAPKAKEWLIIAPWLVIAVAFTTAILLWYAEALAWLALLYMRPRRALQGDSAASAILALKQANSKRHLFGRA